MAYLLHVGGCFYLGWLGNTLEEGAAQEHLHTERSWVALRPGAFSLPHDFDKFDHQPTSSEIMVFQHAIDHAAHQNASAAPARNSLF